MQLLIASRTKDLRVPYCSFPDSKLFPKTFLIFRKYQCSSSIPSNHLISYYSSFFFYPQLQIALPTPLSLYYYPPPSVICSHYSLFSIPQYVPILYFPLLCFLLPHTHFPITPYFLTLLPPLSFLFLPTYHLLSFLLNFYFLVCFPYYLPTAPLPSIL